jgi:pSer/pThr/pTyr-binding forkhead associated (FHA) protein
MSGSKLMKVRVSLKGRPIKSYTFNQDVIMIGRNPEADIFLDNPGISREHLRLEMTSRGFYAAEDLGSANGTVLNDQPIKREYLMNNDVVRIGKFSLWVSYEEDRRESEESIHPQASTFEGTTVLSADELEGMMTTAKEAETETTTWTEKPEVTSFGESQDAVTEAMVRTRKIGSPMFLALIIVLSFLLGTVVGAPWMHVQ